MIFVTLRSVMWIDFQNKVLQLSPALLPLLAFPLSFVQSWHCSMMCGPLYVTKSALQKNRYLQGRFLSYTLAGGLFGFFGATLRKNLEIEILGAISFFVFVFLTLVLAFLWIGKSFQRFKLPSISSQVLVQISQRSSFLHGLLSVALPCGLLYQVFGLSALSNSWVGGVLIGAAHATASMPSFWFSSKLVASLKSFGGRFQIYIKILIFGLIALNLLYFAGSLLHTEEVARSKTLFCL